MVKNAPYHQLNRMKDRIRQIMESKKMTQQEFAQFIELAPASLSNIFNDRTRPTLNVVEAIKKKIPDINTEWLMFGVGQMYNNASAVISATPSALAAPSNEQSVQNDHVERRDPILDFDFNSSLTPEIPSPHQQSHNSVKNTRQNIVRDEVKYIDKPKRRVTEIRVFYDDQTWESFIPSTNAK